MPNWCYNSLNVSGDTDAVMGFIADNWDPANEDERNALAFGALMPVSEDLTNEQVSLLWGTKWEPNGGAWDITPHAENTVKTTAGINFDTAWAPPESWFIAVVALYPELHLTLTYEESGMGLYGTFTGEQGNTTWFENEAPEWDEEEDA